MNADGSDQRRLISNISNISYPSWSPDDTRIVFDSPQDGDYDIYVITVDGSTPLDKLTDNTIEDVVPDWSPDGTRIAFISNRDGNRYIRFVGTHQDYDQIDAATI